MIGVSASCVPDAGSKAIGSRFAGVLTLGMPNPKETILLVVRKDSHTACSFAWMPFADCVPKICGQSLLAVGSPSDRKYDMFCVLGPVSLVPSVNAPIAVRRAAS